MIVHESLKNNIFHTDYGNEFKNQLIGDTLDALKLLLADYVNWFNNHRIHSSPGCLTPVEYRMNKLKKVVWFTVDNPDWYEEENHNSRREGLQACRQESMDKNRALKQRFMKSMGLQEASVQAGIERGATLTTVSIGLREPGKEQSSTRCGRR